MSSNSDSDPGGDSGPAGPKQEEEQRKVVDAVEATAEEPCTDGQVMVEGKLVGSSDRKGDVDVTLMEAVEEVAGVGEVRVVVAAGDAVMTDAGGGDEVAVAAAVNDLLYATEVACLVSSEGCGDESGEGAKALNGEGGREERVVQESGSVQCEVEGKLIQVEAVADDAMGVSGSAAPVHAEAGNEGTHGSESDRVDKSCVNATPSGVGNKERDNGIAHGNNEITNSVLGDVKGCTKICVDDRPPIPEEQFDRSELLQHDVEQISDNGDNQSSNEIVGSTNSDHRVRYCLPPLDKGGFRVSDLVWGKVKSHPWWPGEIFDASDASELALKHQKKGCHLVAYFGDNTFAWCDESQLKPFLTNYSQMEKQSSSDAFINSVNHALEEVSRRVLSGMSCSCLPEELSDNGMSYMVENAGLRDEITCSAVDKSDILNYFSPENLLHYVKSLALLPGQGGDLLELVIACSQLTSFYRSKGCPELPSFQTGSAWVENDIDAFSTKSAMSGEAVTDEVHPSHDKPKRGRGRPPKQKHEDDLELTAKKVTSNLTNGINVDDSLERVTLMDYDDFDDSQNRKKRSLDSFGDSQAKLPTPTFGSSFKIGECIRRAASQLTGSSSIVKSQNEPTVQRNSAEAENGEFDISSDDAAIELTVEKRAKRRRIYRHHAADPEELFSQLCLVATEPMNGYSFSSMIISYFSDYRNYVVSTTTEASIIEKVKSKRGRKRKILPSPEIESTDHMQDSYWSGFSLNNHPIHNLRRTKTNAWPRGRRRSSRETHMPSSDHLSSTVQHLHVGLPSPKKQIQVIERPIIHVEEKMVNECKPTALVLSFGRSTALPSETDLVRMFSRYGPLKETETEVHKNTNSVKVVFKKYADAERAFSIAGKYSSFGRSLHSYRLVNMPFSLSMTEINNLGSCPEDGGLEVPVPRESELPPDHVETSEASLGKADIIEQTVQTGAGKEASVEQDNSVDPTDKAEAVKQASIEKVDMVEQIWQSETVHEASVNQVNMVEQMGQIDSEQAGQIEAISETSGDQVVTVKQMSQANAISEAPIEQDWTVAQSVQAESVTNGLPEQVNMIEQATQVYTEDETSVKGQLDTTQAGAAAGASSGGNIGETKLIEAPIQTSVEIPSHMLQMKAVSKAPTENTIEQNLHAEATIEESAEVLSDKMQMDAVPEAPEEAHVCTDGTVVEAIAEASTCEQLHTGQQTVQEASAEVPIGAMQIGTLADALQVEHVLSESLHFKAQTEEAVKKVDVTEHSRQEPPTEGSIKVVSDTSTADASIEASKNTIIVDTVIGVPDEAEVCLDEFQAQTLTEKPGEQDAIEQAVQVEAPSDVNLKVEALDAESVEQDTTEPVEVRIEESAEVLSDAIPANTLEIQVSEVPLTSVQFQSVSEASLEQQGTTSQADPMEALAKELVKEAGTIEQTVESKTVTEVSARQVYTVNQTVTETGAIEQTVESKTASESSAEQVYTKQTIQVEAATKTLVERADIVEQTAHIDAVTEASAGQVGVAEGTMENEIVVEPTIKQAVMVEKAVDSEVAVGAPVEETVENEAQAEQATESEAPAKALAMETEEEEAMAKELDDETAEDDVTADASAEEAMEAPVEEIEEAECTAEAPVEEIADAEQTAEAPVEETAEDEVTADARAKEAVEAPIGEIETAECTAEVEETAEAEAPVKETTNAEARAEETVGDETVIAPDEQVDVIEQTS